MQVAGKFWLSKPHQPASWENPGRMRALCGNVLGQQVLGQRSSMERLKIGNQAKGASR